MAIFDGKARLKRRNELKVQKAKSGHSIKVVDVDHLLSSKHHKAILAQVEKLSELEGQYYTPVYQRLIRNFAAYVQVLPATMRGGLSGLLNESLFTAYYNLKSLVAEKKEAADPLLRYVVFSASLLRRVAHVVERFRVIITDDKGHYRHEWRPFESSMIDQGAEYYKLFPIGPLLTTNHAVLMGMIVDQLMPDEGLDWIAADPELFHEWLNAMELEDGHLQGRVGLALAYILREDADFLLDALPDVLVEQVETPDTMHGEALYAWLKRCLEDQSLAVNSADAMVHVVNSGLFIELPGVVRDFASRIYNMPVNFNIVYRQFANLFGYVKWSATDHRFAQYFSDYPGTKSSGAGAGIMSRPASSMRQGVVIQNAHNFYMNGEVPDVSKHLKSADNHSAQPNLNALPTIERNQQIARQKNTAGRDRR
jgi:hypothetical protein